MLNTFLHHEMIDHQCPNPTQASEKPASVLLYNKTMGALDGVDNVIQRYNTSRKTRRWYKKVSFRFMDIAYHNSYVLYKELDKEGRKNLPFKIFLMELVEEILTAYPRPPTPIGRPTTTVKQDRLTGMHLPEKIVSSDGRTKQMDCGYCKLLTEERRGKTTHFRCTTCNIPLCISSNNSCFTAYHTKPKLPKKVTYIQNIEQYV